MFYHSSMFQYLCIVTSVACLPAISFVKRKHYSLNKPLMAYIPQDVFVNICLSDFTHWLAVETFFNRV